MTSFHFIRNSLAQPPWDARMRDQESGHGLRLAEFTHFVETEVPSR